MFRKRNEAFVQMFLFIHKQNYYAWSESKQYDKKNQTTQH
jgi:hypothetical protein